MTRIWHNALAFRCQPRIIKYGGTGGSAAVRPSSQGYSIKIVAKRQEYALRLRFAHSMVLSGMSARKCRFCVTAISF
jgi:hypothetical protein